MISLLTMYKDGLIKQTTWWPYKLFCKYIKGHLISVHMAYDVYAGDIKPR
jgi:alpha-N-arabinofuranosidase